MEMTALNELANFKSRIDAKLAYMMNNHTNFSIEAKIKAPTLIFSDGKSDLLVIDFGFMTLNTEKLAKVEHEKSMNEGASRNSVVKSEENAFDNDLYFRRLSMGDEDYEIDSGKNLTIGKDDDNNQYFFKELKQKDHRALSFDGGPNIDAEIDERLNSDIQMNTKSCDTGTCKYEFIYAFIYMYVCICMRIYVYKYVYVYIYRYSQHG
jgi:hypothetical protein